MQVISSSLLLALMVVTAAAGAMPSDRIYARVAPSVWRVVAYNMAGKPFKMGSGVVVARETVLTNCHVAADASHLTINRDNLSIAARVPYADPAYNMCQLTAPNLSAPVVELGDSSALTVGQRVYALGNPKRLDLTLSDGLILALRKDAHSNLFLIQATAPIPHGSSGGAAGSEKGAGASTGAGGRSQ